MAALDYLIPRRQNDTQRKGFVTAVVTIVMLVFLHNPLDGYRIEESMVLHDEILKPSCTQKDAMEAERLTRQGSWPIEKWDFWANNYFDPLPDGIATWPLLKKLEWQNAFTQRAKEIKDRCIEV